MLHASFGALESPGMRSSQQLRKRNKSRRADPTNLENQATAASLADGWPVLPHQRNVTDTASVKLLVVPGFASRYQAWNFQVSPGCTAG